MLNGYSWVRLDANYYRHPRIIAAGRDGRATHLASICWSFNADTDGHVPPDAVKRILQDAEVGRRSVDAVVDAGLWVPNGHGFVIHDYLDRQPSAEEKANERNRWKVSKQKQRSRNGDRRSDETE